MSGAYNEDGTLKSLEEQSYEILLERVAAQEKRIQEWRDLLNNRENVVGGLSTALSDFYEEYPTRRQYITSSGTVCKRPRLRTSMLIGSEQWVEINSSLPLSGDEKLVVAQRLREQVADGGAK